MKETKEEWITVKYQGVEYPNYEVSTLGRARKTNKGVTKFICRNTNIRRSMSLTNGIKSVKAPFARVMLSSFRGTLFTRTKVADHINNNPLDDRLCNLQAITQSQNVRKDGYWTKPENKVKFKNKNSLSRYVTVTRNRYYNPITVYLGLYETVDQAVVAQSLARDIIDNYKITNNDKIALAIIEEIKIFRKSEGLKKVNRGWLCSSKRWRGTFYSHGIYRYVYNNFFIV